MGKKSEDLHYYKPDSAESLRRAKREVRWFIARRAETGMRPGELPISRKERDRLFERYAGHSCIPSEKPGLEITGKESEENA